MTFGDSSYPLGTVCGLYVGCAYSRPLAIKVTFLNIAFYL